MEMPNTRFTISTDPEVQPAIKAHADAAGMDVSAYVVAAVVAQMTADDAASAAFGPLDEANASAMQESIALTTPAPPAFEELSAEEQALIRRVVSSALGSDHADVA